MSRECDWCQKCVSLAVFGLLVAATSCQSARSQPSGSSESSQANFTGVLTWKGSNSRNGVFASETTLTTSNVSPGQFGLIGNFQGDGLIVAQPLYVANVNMGPSGVHNIIILATENDSVYAVDADNLSGGSLWERHYLDPANGIVPLPDNFGGRTTLGGEVGITGTPILDPSTGVLYFVTTYLDNGVAEQWLRSIDVRTGQDSGPGGVQIQASVPGTGKGSVNGQIPFDPSLQNQRSGLAEINGSILVGWASFSDWGVYHGWLMAFDASTLQLQAVFNPTTQAQAVDPADGPADHGGGGGIWQGGAAPAVDSAGNIYVEAADGSFNADEQGNNYGDTLLKLRLNGGQFQLQDWFTPSNQACLDVADLELGSGGLMLLPAGSANFGVTIDKEGRLFLVNTDTLGHFNASADQIPQEFMVGEDSCTSGVSGVAEGTTWNRLYGDTTYWNGYLYAQASNLAMKQYQFQNGSFNPTPIAESPSASGPRGANIVVSANGNQNGIVWAYEKTTSGQAILHAYDATSVSHELWNSNMNSSDQLGTGIAFDPPVVAQGRLIVTSNVTASVYGLLH